LPETPIEGARIFGDRLREMIELEPVIYDNTTIPITSAWVRPSIPLSSPVTTK